MKKFSESRLESLSNAPQEDLDTVQKLTKAFYETAKRNEVLIQKAFVNLNALRQKIEYLGRAANGAVQP